MSLAYFFAVTDGMAAESSVESELLIYINELVELKEKNRGYGDPEVILIMKSKRNIELQCV